MKNKLFLFFLLFNLQAMSQLNPAHKVYYGLLHAHTLLSDGSGTPAEAYAMAKANGLHFFAVTEHNHDAAEAGAKDRTDGVQIATQPELYNGNGMVSVTRNWKQGGTMRTETISVKPLIKAAKDASTANFVGLYGQEFSTISSSNHVNVLGIDELLTIENGDFASLVSKLKSFPTAPVVQLNHPDVAMDLFYHGNKTATRKKMFNDYGIDPGDLGPHFKDLIAALDPFAHLIEVLSGPALSATVEDDFQYDAHENDYFFYLKQGFHLSPSVGQDNHYKTWGSITDARVGLIATSLSAASITEAFRLNRTFATEDKNLKVILYINGQLMGSSIQAEEESELNIQVLVEDADEPDSEYEISIYGADTEAELSTEAVNWKAKDGLLETIEVSKNGVYTIRGIFAVKAPSFFYARIVQNSTDDAWTAPVWVNEETPAAPATLFYWTSNTSSKVYHVAGCHSVGRIKPANLQSGSTPPPGRTLHECIVTEAPEDH